MEGGRHETPAGPPTTCDAPCLMSRVHHASKYSPRGHSLGFALGELAAGPEVLGESPSRHVLVDQVPEAVLRRFFKSDRKEKKKTQQRLSSHDHTRIGVGYNNPTHFVSLGLGQKSKVKSQESRVSVPASTYCTAIRMSSQMCLRRLTEIGARSTPSQDQVDAGTVLLC